MTIQIELWHVLSLAVSLVLGYWALVKVIVAQFSKNLDVRFQAQEDVRSLAQQNWTTRFDQLETGQRTANARFELHVKEYNRAQQEMPEKYQRREDAIRQEVAIIARLDGLAGLVENKFQKTDEKIEGLRRAQ